MANRRLAFVRKMHNWALSKDLIEFNPISAITRPGAEEQRDRLSIRKSRPIPAKMPKTREFCHEAEQPRSKRVTHGQMHRQRMGGSRLVPRLNAHQVEPEMHNVELPCARTAVQEVSKRYQDLFNLAPTGYFPMDEQGRMLQVNLAGAALLGLDQGTAVSQNDSRCGATDAPGSTTKAGAGVHRGARRWCGFRRGTNGPKA